MLLALDTATQTASIAVYNLKTHQLLSEWTWQARRRQTQDLMVATETMLRQIDLSPKHITALAVTIGPGSFTGVRIAISAAKGIGLGLPSAPEVVGMPTLSVTAAPLLALTTRQDLALCVYLQAGRGRYNWAFVSQDIDSSPALWSPLVADHESGTAEDFAARLAALTGQSILLVGESTPALEAAMVGINHVTLFDSISSSRRAGQLARLAVEHISAGNTSSLAALSPMYLNAL